MVKCALKSKLAINLSLLIIIMTSQPLLASDDPLLMGVFPRRNATITMTLFRPLAEYLSNELGREVTVVTASDFDSFWKDVEQRRFDIVHFNQYHYLKSHKKYGYEVFAQNQEFGKRTLAGVIYVRDDSNITSLEQLKGKRVVFGGGSDAFVSYISAYNLLKRAGVEKETYETLFAKNPPNAIMSVYLNQSAAGAAGDIGIQIPIIKDRIDTSKLRILAQTRDLPHIPWALKTELPDSLRKKIAGLILGLNESNKGRSILSRAKLSGISPARDSDYNIVREITKEAIGENY